MLRLGPQDVLGFIEVKEQGLMRPDFRYRRPEIKVDTSSVVTVGNIERSAIPSTKPSSNNAQRGRNLANCSGH